MWKIGTRELAASAIMGALVCVATLFFYFPIPATQGYFNVGDAMVIVAALTFGPVVGCIAGGLGSALADFLGGWYVWVPFTLIIKGIEGLLAGWVLGTSSKEGGTFRIVLAWIIGGLEMVTGYFLVQVYLYGFGAALVEAPFNFVQMGVSGIIGVPISIALKKRLRI